MGPQDRSAGGGSGRETGPWDTVISVIVPTYNRPASLEATLAALAGQSVPPHRFEVIVCDDGSAGAVTAQERALLAALGGSVQARLLQQENAGPAEARNLGASAARGRYLAFTDDDCVPEPDWLERILARFEASPDVLLGGGLRNGLARDVYADATQAIMDFVYGEQERSAGPFLFSSSNLSLPADGFHAIGGFSPEFPDAAGEDYDLCWRWHQSGRAAEYAPEAVIVHTHGHTLRGFLRQHFNYGRGLLRARRRRGVRTRLEPARGSGFYLRLVLHPIRHPTDGRGWRCAAIIAASQMATALGAAVELVRPSGSRSRTAIVKATVDG